MSEENNNIIRNPNSISLVTQCNARVNDLINILTSQGTPYQAIYQRVLLEKQQLSALLQRDLRILERDTSITVGHNH
jgi:hypothetical protein